MAIFAVVVKTVLVTGASGQDGYYLIQQLLQAGFDPVAACRESANTQLEADGKTKLASIQLKAAEQLSGLDKVAFDLDDSDSIADAILQVKPQLIFHLAAPTFVPDSFSDPLLFDRQISQATGQILKVAKSLESECRVLVASSSEIYSEASESPQSEATPWQSRTPYGQAKIAASQAVVDARNEGLFALSAITFNHESPLRPKRFLSRKVTSGVAAIAAGHADDLTLGSLETVRDWSHAQDITSGMIAALTHDDPADYVFASGIGRTVNQLVDAAFKAANVERTVDGVDRVKIDQRFVRPPEQFPLVGNPRRAQDRLSWKNEISFERMIEQMVAVDLEAEMVNAKSSSV